MGRDIATFNKVAILATGDEITNGDILNTNSQVIAQTLFAHGIHAGTHIAVPDTISEIESAITYLLKNHRALIITGGLGPTSDDLTRYALSKALNQPLVFHEACWETICGYFHRLGYKDPPPEGNRQQALFPAGATLIPNPNGTAAGCMIQYQEQLIFMLPGPPMECLPMMDHIALPAFKQAGYQDILFFKHWLLFGVSESAIAEQFDTIAKPFDCTTGYRLAYPYIEFKLHSNNKTEFETLVSHLEPVIVKHLISDGVQTASAMLQKKLENLNFILSIQDHATGGLLESTLKSPATYQHLTFAAENSPMVSIHGLKEFWLGNSGHETDIEIIFSKGETIKRRIPFRGSRVKQYAVEFICYQIYRFLTTNDTN